MKYAKFSINTKIFFYIGFSARIRRNWRQNTQKLSKIGKIGVFKKAKNTLPHFADDFVLLSFSLIIIIF